ncbi:MAG: HAMP domain-containing sensor histidine kinase [Bacteroidota bacterium]
MKAYRTSVKIKLGLIVAAVAIAVGSLVYTNDLAERIMERERGAIQLWATAIEYQGAASTVGNPYAAELRELAALIAGADFAELDLTVRDSLAAAVAWARSQPTSEELNFVFNEVIEPQQFSVPAIITDTATTVVYVANNVRVDSSQGDAAVQDELLRRAAAFDGVHEPIRMSLGGGVEQLVHYGESDLVRVLRSFPYVQLLVVGLFILVGYLGFSYVRRNEQSSLWVGMAKEAAHQLGTPLSSMLGWIELLRLQNEDDDATLMAADELDKDVERLRRVADRFQKIGSVPEVRPHAVAPVVENVAAYVRRRVPQQGRRVTVATDVPADLAADLNPDLFEWVIENLLKNALDAMEANGAPSDGAITVTGSRSGDAAVLDVRDTGKGMDRATARHVFRPGFSTKKRGWGLGLSLAKRIVEDYHGGTLTLLDTRPGQGTCFRIRLAAASLPGQGDGAPTGLALRQPPTAASGIPPQATP